MKLFTGYTYLSIFLGKLSVGDSSVDYFDYRSSLSDPFLKVSVFTAGDNLLEESVEIWNPVLVRSNLLYWGWDWTMHTPLENVPAGYYYIIAFVVVDANITITIIIIIINIIYYCFFTIIIIILIII